jgi:hypothetical protein
MDPEQSIKNRLALEPYKLATTRYIRSAMARKGIKYNELAVSLAQKGVVMTPANLRSKVSKGMLAADLLVAIIEVLDIKDDTIQQIIKLVHEA